MKLSGIRFGWMFGMLLFSGIALGQEPELPFAWEGKGEATFISRNGQRNLEFQLKFHVDEEGNLSGGTSTEEGSTDLERLYYGESIKSESIGLESRRLVLVLTTKNTETPILVILSGLVLGDQYFYGEIRLTRPNIEGVKEGLDLGSKVATPLDGDNLTTGLQKALKQTIPMGHFNIVGNRVEDR